MHITQTPRQGPRPRCGARPSPRQPAMSGLQASESAPQLSPPPPTSPPPQSRKLSDVAEGADFSPTAPTEPDTPPILLGTPPCTPTLRSRRSQRKSTLTEPLGAIRRRGEDVGMLRRLMDPRGSIEDLEHEEEEDSPLGRLAMQGASDGLPPEPRAHSAGPLGRFGSSIVVARFAEKLLRRRTGSSKPRRPPVSKMFEENKKRNQRRVREKQWLTADSQYMQDRLKELKGRSQQAAQEWANDCDADPCQVYEARTYFGPTSMRVRANRVESEESKKKILSRRAAFFRPPGFEIDGSVDLNYEREQERIAAEAAKPAVERLVRLIEDE